LAAMERRNSFYAVFVAGAILLVLVLVIVLSNAISTLVVERIIRLRNAAQNVERGDLAVNTADNLADEIGELATSFNGMVGAIKQGITDLAEEKASVERKVEEAVREMSDQRAYLQESVAEMLSAVERFAQGDLTKRLKPRRNDDIGRLFEGYNQATENVRQIMAKIIEESEITASASVEITSSIEHMTRGIQRQQQQSTHIAVSTEEMSKTIEETTQNTTLVATQAQAARKEAESGGDSLRTMIEAIGRVNEIVSRSAGSMQHLSSSSEQISEMAASIADIADQTNLLALNAAIEAARAGEQGRGFAVVADEVRKLAERTQTATKEISQVVRTIKQDTESVVETMNAGVREVETAHLLVGQTSSSLNQIITAIREISDFITQLATTSEEQHATSSDIAGNMDTMTMVISQSVAVSEEIARTADSLSQMTMTVQRMMQTFTVEEKNSSVKQLV
nr:methyl-accepting chemotaxis protein [Candidatus Kapabacteria bacterium]